MVLTVDQAARLLDVHRSTIYRLFETGELKKVKFGRSTRVQLSEDLEKVYKDQISKVT